MYFTTVLICITTFLAYFLLRGYKTKRPPGPFRWPIVGNAFQMPRNRQWIAFSHWRKTYGDITYLEVFGRPMAVINSFEMATELLDKRSALYSSRPTFVMVGEVCKMAQFIPLAPYGEEWRAQRKVISFALTKSAAAQYSPLQEGEARLFVRKMIEHPEELFPEIKVRTASVIMRVNWGYYPNSLADPFLDAGIKTNAYFSQVSAEPWIVDLIPAFQYLPSWVPGTTFHKVAKEVIGISEGAAWEPYLWCKNNLTSGKSLQPNITSTVISEAPEGVLSDEAEERLVRAVSSAFGGGVDTSMSFTLSFFLEMLLHPEVQSKAQQELDRVVGTDRLPTLEDQPRLPYLRSVIAEVMRLRPITPLSIPHSLIQDDVYADKFCLPKDTMIIPNIWCMLRDPERYPNPERFDPDRYDLSDDAMQIVTDITFGFGRRACPGKHVGYGTVFAFASTVLATCTIVPAKDEKGTNIIPDAGTTGGALQFPNEFACRFEPRSQEARGLLEQESAINF